MALKKKKSISIKKYKNKREMNLGIFLFAIIFLYLIITIISYFTSDTVSAYEVREGSIVRDNSYTGLVIRKEEVVNAEEEGYVNFYQSENSKVKKGTRIYVLTPEELDPSEVSSESARAAVNDETQSGIALQVQNFNENYSNADFSSVYVLKEEITASLQSELSQTRTEHLDTAVADSGQKAVTCPAARDGIVAYTIDGMEDLTKDSFTEADFDRTNYESTTVSDQMQISAGDPVYKLITDEDWSVIVHLEDDTARELMEKETTTLKVRIDKDSETLNAAFSVIERDGNYYGCLDFDNSMIRYAETGI